MSNAASKLSLAAPTAVRANTRGAPRAEAPSAKTLGRPRDPEILTFAASMLSDLPCPPTLSLHVPGVPGVVRIDTATHPSADSGERDQDVGADHRVWGGAEWRALVLGVEADRVWPMDLQRFARRGQADPHWRLSVEEALAGAQPDRSRRWTLGELLDRVGAHLVGVEVAASHRGWPSH